MIKLLYKKFMSKRSKVNFAVALYYPTKMFSTLFISETIQILTIFRIRQQAYLMPL